MQLITASLLGGAALCTSPAKAGCDKTTVLATHDLNLGMLRYQPGVETGWALISPNGTVSLSSGLSMSSRTSFYPGQVRIRARPGYNVSLYVEASPTAPGEALKITELYVKSNHGYVSRTSNIWTLEIPKNNHKDEMIDIQFDIGAYFQLSNIGIRDEGEILSSVKVRCLFEFSQ